MPHGGCSSREDIYIKLVDLSREIDASIDRYVDKRKEVERSIGAVPDATLQTLLRYRYLNGMTFEKIAVEMNYCYMQICRLHGKALDELVIEK